MREEDCDTFMLQHVHTAVIDGDYQYYNECLPK